MESNTLDKKGRNRADERIPPVLKVIAHVLRFFAIGLYFLFLISPSVTILSSVEEDFRATL